MPTRRYPAANTCAACRRPDAPLLTLPRQPRTFEAPYQRRTQAPLVQCKPTRQNASEIAPIKISIAAQVVSRLNQLRATNFSPRWR
jgi:hypothetical protein